LALSPVLLTRRWPRADKAALAFALGVGASHALLFWLVAVFRNLKPTEPKGVAAQ
jgi:hypothetical protein